MRNDHTKLMRHWLIALIICSLIVVFFQIFFNQNISSDFSVHMQNQRKNSISKMVQLSYNTIKPVINKVKSGELDINEARKIICDTVRSMTYEDEFGLNYIFMSTYEGIMLVQPFEPQKEGTSQWGLKDAKGNYIIRELVNAARQKPEGSFVAYYYYPPNSIIAEEKLSYVVGIPEINAYIGTGMYLESSYRELDRILEYQRYGYIALTLFILSVMMLYLRELLKNNKLLTKEIQDRERAEARLKSQFEELQATQDELQQKHWELSRINEELVAAEEGIRDLAYNDYLTGLPNRVFIVNELANKLCESSTGKCSGAVFFIDMDNFKFINDTFGHFCGDRVLIEISHRLKSLKYGGMVISRIGGDEFIIIQDDCIDESEIKELAQNILSLFINPVNIDRNSFNVSCSIGIALYPKHGSTADEILKNADMAMYKAKGSGKNGYILYDSSMGAELTDRIEMEKQLRRASENGEFELYYQPNYDVMKGSISGFEALIRWNSPVYGMVLPGRFISIAEEMGLINKIGKWVIDRSFAFARTLQGKDICVSCNVSPVQLIQSGFVEDAIEAFDKYGLKEGSVALEITESSLVESFKETIEKLGRLRDKGILIYLDDFGTGYSSLTYMNKLPIDVVKIDKSFVDGITSDSVDTRIVKAVISLAHEIGLKVVAEGVETSEQLQYLTEYKCNHIQGYLISRPVPEHQAAGFINEN